MLTRRHLLAGAAGLVASADGFARANPGQIFVVGNSFVAQHDVGARLQFLLAKAGDNRLVTTLARNGAWLADHLATGSVERELRSLSPNWVVLQDHSLAGLTSDGRARSRAAIETILRLTNACPVYLTPWPREAGHKLFATAGMPSSPKEMVARTMRHYDSVADDFGGHVSPVAEAWQTLVAAGFDLHAPDGYHASEDGAWFVAMVLSASLGVDPRWGSPARLAYLSSLAKVSVLKPATCAAPTA